MSTRPDKRPSQRRAALSCTACAQAKKKCDEARPICSRCMRKYPVVECVYKTKKRPTSENEAPFAEDEVQSSSALTHSHSLLLLPSTPSAGKSRVKNVPVQVRRGHQPLVEKRKIERLTALYRKTAPVAVEIYDEESGDIDFEKGGTIPFQDNGPILVEETKTQPTIRNWAFTTTDILTAKGIPAPREYGNLLDLYNHICVPGATTLDGNLKGPNQFTRVWQHYGTLPPLMIRSQLFTAAQTQISQPSFLHARDTLVIAGHQPNIESDLYRTLTGLRLDLLRELNTRLRGDPPIITDDLIAVVLPFLYEKWLFRLDPGSDTPHVKGIVEMLRIRGGLRELGMNGLLTKMVLLCAYNLASTTCTEPFISLKDRIVPELLSSQKITPRLCTPFFSVFTPEDHEPLGITNAMAPILNDVSFLSQGVQSYVIGRTTDAECTDFILAALDISKRLNASIPSPTDRVHNSILFAARLYCQSILTYSPLCTLTHAADTAYLIDSLRPASLDRWVEIPGVWLWVVIIASAVAKGLAEGIMLRMQQHSCCLALSVEEGPGWSVVVRSMEVLMSVQQWSREPGKRNEEGAKEVLKFLE